ncbi:ABC transporter substrate-binding protein [Bacillus salipaludis]|uniref:ABC transporter substrate-binding protein n=1 Tax=Bacillus salipaludis TaxID=2547811 RepID=A0ABW8RI89_9BACI
MGKRKSNKFLYLFSGLLVLMFALAGCSSSNEANGKSADGKTKLTIHYYVGAISKGSIDAAKKNFPKYNLDFVELPADNNYDVKLKTSLNSKSAPDIAAVNSNIQDFLPYANKFVNLLDYGANDLADQYVEWKWESAKTGDKKSMIAMPLDIGPTGLFYREDLFKEAGLPADPKEVSEKIVTADDYLAAAKQMKEKINKPMFLSAVGILGERYRALDSGMYNEDGKLILADGKLKKEWDFVVKAINEGYTLGTKSNSIDNVNAINEGMYGAYIGASWGVMDVKDADKSAGKWRIAKTPGGYSNQGGSYLAVLGNTKHPKEAVEVVKFLTNEASQLSNLTENSLFPSLKSIYDKPEMVNKDDFFGGQEINEYFIDAANNISYVYRDPKDTSAFRYFEDQITLVETQGKDPEKAWKDAVKKAEGL